MQVPEGLQGGESKLAVDLLVGSPVAVGEHTALWHTVEEGPQDCIAEAIVVQRSVSFCQATQGKDINKCKMCSPPPLLNMYMEMDGLCSYIELMFLNPCLTEAIWLDASLEVGLVSSGLDSGMMSVSDMPAPGQPSHLPTRTSSFSISQNTNFVGKKTFSFTPKFMLT